MQASTLCCSWSGDNSWGIQTPYFHVLSNSYRCVSIAIWKHLRRSSKHLVVNRESCSISSFKRSISTSNGLPLWGKSSNSKLPFLNRSNQCCAVRMESTALPIVPHILLVASVALRPNRNSWSKSNRNSLRDNFICNSRSTSISIILLSFEQYSYHLYILLIWNILERSQPFQEIFEKNAKIFLPTQ